LSKALARRLASSGISMQHLLTVYLRSGGTGLREQYLKKEGKENTKRQQLNLQLSSCEKYKLQRCSKNLTINSPASAQSLQEDLHNLEHWEKEWSMEFNPDKCEVLRIHRKKETSYLPIHTS